MVPPSRSGAEDKMEAMGKKVDPEMEEIVKKIQKLIQEKQVSDVAMKSLQDRQSVMETDLEHLNQEIYCLATACNMKEANLKRLQFQYEQSQAQTERQLQGTKKSKQRIEAMAAQIEAEKLQRRKERKVFEQQLEELIRKHKWTAEFYTPARLQREVHDIENSKLQLLNEEQATREKLNTVDKELNALQQHTASDEQIFLQSKEAKITHELVEGENKMVWSTLHEMKQWDYELGENAGREKILAGKDPAVRGDAEEFQNVPPM